MWLYTEEGEKTRGMEGGVEVTVSTSPQRLLWLERQSEDGWMEVCIGKKEEKEIYIMMIKINIKWEIPSPRQRKRKRNMRRLKMKGETDG